MPVCINVSDIAGVIVTFAVKRGLLAYESANLGSSLFLLRVLGDSA
jgi:hypothetical protein